MTLLIDGMFSGQLAIHASGDRVDAHPAHVIWDRITGFGSGMEPQPIWFTDGSMALAEAWHGLGEGHTTVGLLLEPPHLHPENFEQARRLLNEGHLHYLFTHQPDSFIGCLNRDRVHTYPLGGTRIHESDWRPTAGPYGRDREQTPNRVAAIVSEKRALPGHILRHEVVERFNGRAGFEVYGPGYVALPRNSWGHDSKIPALRDATFALAIEALDTGVLISEHTLDCFLTGTIPIYWGSEEALKRCGFDRHGMIIASDREELTMAVQYALDHGEALYEETYTFRVFNWIVAHEFVSTEDWLWRKYPELFR